MGLQTPYPLEAMPAVRTARDVSDRGQNVASNHQLRLLLASPTWAEFRISVPSPNHFHIYNCYKCTIMNVLAKFEVEIC